MQRPARRAPTASGPTAARTRSGRSTSPRRHALRRQSGTAPSGDRDRLAARPEPRTARTGRSCASIPTAPRRRTTRSTTARTPGDRGCGSTASATRSGSPCSPTPKRSSSATSAGTPGRRSTTASRASNFGWPCYEGNGPQPTYQSQFPRSARSLDRAVIPPFYTYDHGTGSAVIGGPFYTGTAYPHAVPGQLLLRRLLGQLHQAGGVRRPASARSRCSCSRPTSQTRSPSPWAPTG